MNLREFAVICIAFLGTGKTLADGKGLRLWPHFGTSACPSLCGSPDDYCRKSCPRIIPIRPCGSPDDYCRKAMPCLGDVPRCGGPDDYCKKCLPSLLCPPLSPCLHPGAAKCACPPSTHPASR